MYWTGFFISAVLISLAGSRLTAYADLLAERTRIGKAWIGAVLLGGITSLPEAVSSFYAVTELSANDLAVGNILGSNMFNPLMIVLMDLIYREGAVTNIIRPDKSHQYSVLFAITLNIIVMMEIILGRYFVLPSFGALGPGTVAIFLVYFGGMWYLGQLGMNAICLPAGPAQKEVTSFGKIWLNIGVCSLVVVIAAMWLAESCERIAFSTGLGRTFVGSVFLAIVTSLPEAVVVIAALRMGSADLAIGNIFGSNMVNILILAVCGLFNRTGEPLLEGVSVSHVFTASLGIVMTYLAWVGLQIRNKKSFLGFGLDSIIMMVVFLGGMVVLYLIR